MSDQVAIEVIGQPASRTSVEVIEQQGVNIVEINAATQPVVEVLHPGPQGAAGATTLLQLTDVDVTNRTDGSVLYFDATRQKAVFDSIETKINLTDGGNF